MSGAAKRLHGLTGVTCGVSRVTGGTGKAGKVIGLESGVLDGSAFGVATGTGTSKPGFVAAEGMVFSTGGSWNGEGLGFGRSGTWSGLAEGSADDVSRIKGSPFWAPITITFAFADFARSNVASIPFHRKKFAEIPGVTIC
jgi:hypothetical protein